MARISLTLFIAFSYLICVSQTFDAERITTWQQAGLSMPVSAPENVLNVIDFGGDNSGTNSNNSAYASAIASLNGAAGTVYFPEGEYLFTSGISIPTSVFLSGESFATILKFNLGGSGDLILLNGSVLPLQYVFASDAIKGSHDIQFVDASNLAVGDVIRLYQFDEDYMFSSWAYGSLGQVIEIVEVNGNSVTLADPLNHHFTLTRNAYAKKLVPRRAAGMECLTIERLDASVGQTSNIYVNNAFNCFFRNLELKNCNFAHIDVNSSAHIQVEGCYFHDAFAYGGGGQGYGLVFQSASSFCLAQNNSFEHLRHSMLLQSGANGNVFGYNYSYDAYWTEGGFFPTNSAGDAVLHGNYPYLNLFEGNTVQNIVVDASHAKSGPFNTFFRNRAELYGFFSDPNTPTDSMNVVGNETTSTGFPLGLFMLNGNGHYSFGNNVFGTVDPPNTSDLALNSLYLNENELPGFLSSEALPMIGYPLNLNEKLLQAQLRFENGNAVSCSEELVTEVTPTEITTEPLAALFGNELRIHSALIPATVKAFSVDGKLLWHSVSTTEELQLPNFAGNKLIILQLVGENGMTQAFKLVTR